MKILFLARGNFIEQQNTGGLHVTKRNYKLLTYVWGEQNVYICQLTPDNKKDSQHVKYVQYNPGILNRYSLYFRFRELISAKNEKVILNYIEEMKFDYIFFDGSLDGRIAEKVSSDIKKIVYCHNIEQFLFREFYKKENFLFYIRYLSSKYNEQLMIKYADAVICLNKRDNDLLNKYYQKKADLLMPVTFEDKFINKNISVSDSSYLLFVGAYFEPNVRGIEWFISHVSPYINCKLLVVGRGMDRIRDRVNQGNVEVVGEVEDTEDYYRKADAVVMPIFMGGGMKVKTAEALMYGKTIFASKEALEGYHISTISDIFECNSDKEFIDGINQYMKRVDRKKLNTDVRNYFLKEHVTKAYITPLKSLMERI